MKTVLQINSSLFGDQGQSSKLAASLIERLVEHAHAVTAHDDERALLLELAQLRVGMQMVRQVAPARR